MSNQIIDNGKFTLRGTNCFDGDITVNFNFTYITEKLDNGLVMATIINDQIDAISLKHTNNVDPISVELVFLDKFPAKLTPKSSYALLLSNILYDCPVSKPYDLSYQTVAFLIYPDLTVKYGAITGQTSNIPQPPQRANIYMTFYSVTNNLYLK